MVIMDTVRIKGNKMKILNDTLEVVIERWSDPGDYPSAAGSGPLPSYDYLEGVDGEVRIELTDEELVALQEAKDADELKDWVDQLDISLPDGILSATWNVELVMPNIAVLTITEIEPDPCYSGSEPDFDDYGD